MTKLTEKEFDIKKHVAENSIGTIHLPRWASFLLYASRVIVSPVFLVPYLLVLVAMFFASAKPVMELCFQGLSFGAIWLFFTTTFTASQMNAAGVLDEYMAVLLSRSLLGRWLSNKFGRVTK